MREFSTMFKERLKRLLTASYPFYYKRKNIWIIAGALFLMTMTFNYFLEPFEVYSAEHKMNYFWISIIHACSPAAIIILFGFKTTSLKVSQNWTVQKELLLISLFLLIIGITQFLIRDIIYNNPENWSWRYLYEEIRNTYLIGGLFSIILISLNLNRLSYKYHKNLAPVKFSAKNIESKSKVVISIKSKVQGDTFSFNLTDFIYAKAVGNYIEIYLNHNTTERLIKRITLKELEEALKQYSNIFKTHRSFLVNLNYITDAVGNAQGYRIRLANCEEKIPVSRNRVKAFDALVKKE